MNPVDREAGELDARLLEWMANVPAGFTRHAATLAECFDLPPGEFAHLEAEFESLALELFTYQYQRIPLYARYCQLLERTPSRVQRAADIPGMPVEAFREAQVVTFPHQEAVLQFHTSGTTGARPGVHLLPTTALYDLALARAFKHHVLPDCERLRFLIVMPVPQEAPHSSLAYMLSRVRELWGTRDSAHFVRGNRLLWSELRAALEQTAVSGEPVCLLGTTLAWLEVLDACEATGSHLRLPEGSRLMDTGGDKGRRRRTQRPALLQRLADCLGIPPSHVVAEYGMTELGSQYYSLSLRAALAGEATSPDHWSYPFWLRPRLLEQPVGLVAHHDLANRGSVAHIVTADVGKAAGASFVLLGRAPRSDLRGCGLLAEAWEVPESQVEDRTPPEIPNPFAFAVLDRQGAARHWESLQEAAHRWSSTGIEERLERLARAAARLATTGPGRWRRALRLSSGLSDPGLDAAWGVTFHPTTKQALELALAAEQLDTPAFAALQERLPRRLVHVLAGNVLPSTWNLLVRGWLLGAAQWLRPATREPVFATCIHDRLGEIEPALAACTAVQWWHRDDMATAASVFNRAQVVTVQGDDASVAAVRQQVEQLAPTARFLGYDARWSAAWVPAVAQSRETAEGLARDVALFDQQGCLSPTCVFAERHAGLEDWCAVLAQALTAQADTLPAGPIPAFSRAGLWHWRQRQRLALALGHVSHLWEGTPSQPWCVVLLARCVWHEDFESPRDRHLVVVPYDDIEQVRQCLGSKLARLQGLSIAGRQPLPAWLRPTRVAQAGTLQEAPPGWPQDHHPPLRSLLL